MKTRLLLILIFGISICLTAQTSKPGIEIKQKEPAFQLKQDTTEYFAISAKFKSNISEFKINPLLKSPENNFSPNGQVNLVSVNKQIPEFRMPLAGGQFYSNMPIAVPDSSVHYYIKVKRFEYINPLEKNYK